MDIGPYEGGIGVMLGARLPNQAIYDCFGL